MTEFLLDIGSSLLFAFVFLTFIRGLYGWCQDFTQPL